MRTKSILYIDKLIQDTTLKEELEILNYIKECVIKNKEITKIKNIVDISKYFDKLWSLYPRKINKELAKRTFEHKMRGLTEEEVKDKANKIYILQQRYIKECNDNDRDLQYISHYSSFLNANVPNSKHYKGR